MDNKPESHNSKSDEAKKNEKLPPQSELDRSEKTDVPTGVATLRALLNKTLRIEMSDGRVLVGVFLCTDADANVILGSCSEYLPHESRPLKANEEPRMLGLVMVPGKHIVSVCKDLNEVHSDSTRTRDSNSEGVV